MDLRDKYGVNKNLYKEVICPVCGQVTLDSFWICDNCNWEYDDTIDENEYSDANRGSIRDYKEKMGLLEIPNVRFNILPQNLLDFTECISILTNEIGIVGFDMEDFERIINNSHQVNFFSLSGDDMLKIADEFGRFVNYKNCMGGNMLFVLTTNRLPKEAESIEKALDIASENLDIKNFCYNIYERNQEELFKEYMFITEPHKSKLGDKLKTNTSKKLSFSLRHSKEPLYVDLNGGWADVNTILYALKIKLPTLIDVVASDSKRRFSFDETKTKIRANQGHLIKGVIIEPIKATPPDVLYHGTATRFLEKIMQEGLKPIKRNFVHLSADIETAKKVGSRHGKPVVLIIDAKRFYKAENKLFLSPNGIWQAEFIANKYISRKDFNE